MDDRLRRLERAAASGDPEARERLRAAKRRLDPLHWLRLQAHLGDLEARAQLGADAPKSFQAIYLEEAEDAHPNRALRWLTTQSGVYTKLPAIRIWGEAFATWGDDVCQRVVVAALRKCLDAGLEGTRTGTVRSFVQKEWGGDWGQDRLPDHAWSRELRALAASAVTELEAAASCESRPQLEACELFELVAQPGLCWDAFPFPLVRALNESVGVFQGQLKSVGMVLTCSYDLVVGETVFQRGAEPFLASICAEVLPWTKR